METRTLFPLSQPRTDGVRIVKVTPVVIGGGRTTDQIVDAARKLRGKNRLAYINAEITQKNMPSGHGRKRTVTLEWYAFDHDPSIEEVRAVCEVTGYGYPTYEDGLRFQEYNPDAQKKRPHVIIPENPFCDSQGRLRSLYLWNDNDLRVLMLNFCIHGHAWDQGCLFSRRKYLP